MEQDISFQYLAGLFDGKGCVYIQKNKTFNPKSPNKNPTYQVVCQVSMTNKNLIGKLHKTFGGTFYTHKRKKITHRDCHLWFLCSKKANRFLKAIFPYTIVKKEEIKVAFEFQDHIDKSMINGRQWKRNLRLPPEVVAYRESLYQRLKSLKKL